MKREKEGLKTQREASLQDQRDRTAEQSRKDQQKAKEPKGKQKAG